MVQIVKDCGMIPIVPEAGIFLLANWKPLGRERKQPVRLAHNITSPIRSADATEFYIPSV
jgi:hypothetical protein